MRNVFACGGNVEEDLDDDKENVGFIITLQGDKRDDVCNWLISNKLAERKYYYSWLSFFGGFV